MSRNTLLIPAAQARAVLGVSDHVLRRSIARGEIPAVKLGNRYFIPRKALDALAMRAVERTNERDSDGRR